MSQPTEQLEEGNEELLVKNLVSASAFPATTKPRPPLLQDTGKLVPAEEVTPRPAETPPGGLSRRSSIGSIGSSRRESMSQRATSNDTAQAAAQLERLKRQLAATEALVEQLGGAAQLKNVTK